QRHGARDAANVTGRPTRRAATARARTVELSRDRTGAEHLREQGKGRHLSRACGAARTLEQAVETFKGRKNWKLKMTCSFTEKISSLIDGELSSAEAREVERHVLTVSDCEHSPADFL